MSGFFNKRYSEKKIRELPPLPPLPELTPFEEELPELPPMPELEPRRIKEEISGLGYVEGVQKDNLNQKISGLGYAKGIQKELGYEEQSLPELPPLIEDIENLPLLPIKTLPIKTKPYLKMSMEEEPEPATKPVESKKPKSLFIDSSNYKEMLEHLGEVEARLKESADIIKNLNEIKNAKDKEFEKWRLQLEELQRRIMLVDKTLA